MAQNGKAHENEIVVNEQTQKSKEFFPLNFSTEDELLEEFANLIIDIYLENELKHEKRKHPNDP